MALVELGLFESRARAQEAIAAGLVTVDGVPVRKASEGIPPGAVLDAQQPHPWVSRGGVKLAAALDHFGIEPAGRYCLDIGSSTGGFTHVLATRGARRIVAVDVGRDQLHPSLRRRPAIDSREETDARTLRQADLAEAPSLITFDVSFIPLRLVLAPVLALAAPSASAVALIKPQFEAGRSELKKGIVRSPETRAAVCEAVAAEFASLGWRVLGLTPSPIAGGAGNLEFLIAAEKSGAESITP
jgi:23S rRNA (cytidine1920-2'-O)/16S rRNA (cytidine1409-2'-O)-methyltransferase